MPSRAVVFAGVLAVVMLEATGGCVASSAGACGGATNLGDAGACSVGDASYPINCSYDPGFTQTCPNTPNTIGVTFSGETLGVAGLPYVPNLPGDPVFVDGWSVEFLEYIVVVGNVRLDPGATQSSIWQQVGDNVSVSSSTPVAIKPGPFVLDAHQVHGFVGKDGIEAASGVYLWTQQDNGQAFDTSQLYAFSYQVQQAQYPATNVNLTPAELSDYDLMVQNKWTKLIRGIATHTTTSVGSRGGGTPTPCAYANPADPNAAAAQQRFDQLPTTVYFAFGWDDHTDAFNCVNPDNGNGAEDNLANRGVQTNDNDVYLAQITIHTDHVFWDTLQVEGEPLRFDPIAAYAPASTSITEPLWINDLPQQLHTTFSDGVTPLPDRAPFCTGNDLPFTTDMPNGGAQVIMNPNGVTTVPSTSYPDFMEFSVQSQAHLNAQGLCYINGQHAADPFFTPNVGPFDSGG